ncbi:endolytic transglycosylase MltG [Alteromonas sp. 1_MG-2023]|uniref:endolytic transglycosylase MltG n=1 Tax=Alteromonas sp. 1_MG-2023 TaxID=3062669 RepID=UPI0026E42F34|nr:endolytic transglycosylase MltG [Alteromonas sp. 1_MG-2023]MDO6568826.1 endolytic transglycosylase MltG [Alteromonas sp. 1_MG-2023]
MRIIISIGIMLALVVGAVTFGVLYVVGQASSPLLVSEPQLYTVEKGSNGYKVVRELRARELLDSPELATKLWLKFFAANTHVKSGTYRLVPGQSLQEVFGTLSRGEEHYFAVSLVEGLTLKEWLVTLNAQTELKHDVSLELVEETIKAESAIGDADSATTTTPWLSEATSAEGLFLADTYFFTANTAASSILKRAHRAMLDYVDTQWQQRQADLPLNSQYDALILASIIEKETAVSAERTKIAGVFVNRLRKNMRLQTDPTVIYGIGDAYDGNITRKHLRTPTPYNTYTIKGLPPTPIAMAGKEAIWAALNPMETDALYFVARGDGSHEFSSSLAAHNAAVRKYQLNRK